MQSKMRIGIMQPYFFPYIGYFQLFKAIDTFIIYDDVTYIKQGWINRNRILLNGKDFMITLMLNGASSFKLINEIEIGHNKNKLIKTIEHAYKRAPYFDHIFPLLQELITLDESNLAKYLLFSIKKLVNHLGIDVKVLISSGIEKNNLLKGDDKVIDICLKQKATHYINAIGGQNLYQKEKFEAHGLTLNFLKSGDITYKQTDTDFVPWLSIIDVMMFNSPDEIQLMLCNYELV